MFVLGAPQQPCLFTGGSCLGACAQLQPAQLQAGLLSVQCLDCV
jgi:hypothetical protein